MDTSWLNLFLGAVCACGTISHSSRMVGVDYMCWSWCWPLWISSWTWSTSMRWWRCIHVTFTFRRGEYLTTNSRMYISLIFISTLTSPHSKSFWDSKDHGINWAFNKRCYFLIYFCHWDYSEMDYKLSPPWSSWFKASPESIHSPIMNKHLWAWDAF